MSSRRRLIKPSNISIVRLVTSVGYRLSAKIVLLIIVGAVRISAQADGRTSYGIVFDNTGSMFQTIPRAREIAKAVVAKIPKDSEVSVFSFATVPNLHPMRATITQSLECATDRKLINEKLDEIQVARGVTTLFDAIATAADRIRNPVAVHCGRSEGDHILIVLGDGEDRESSLQLTDAVEKARKAGVKIYAVGLIRDLRDSGYVLKTPPRKAKENLIALAKESGGRVIFPKEKAKAQDIADELFSATYQFPKK